MCLQSSTLNNRVQGYLHQPVVESHLENPLLHYLNCCLIHNPVRKIFSAASLNVLVLVIICCLKQLSNPAATSAKQCQFREDFV